ncbi:glycine--tRNA ligase subunit beta [Aerophototrophica crusticola]|uniref:Glycine--tRNA ligase beta subunit n=1 Tax=Aerophototrophica crusticola TaxID=1709002 RepID=A0A858R508_9PROT|nr:glycine--tRNA ligase subunit beta [Rhodospirillaceae bacterium B3]
MAELFIELFMEEIPARMQVRAAEDFRRLVTDKLAAAGLSFDHAEAHSTPRRLALVVDGLPTKQADVREERKGPRVGSPEQALAGFLKAAGLTDISQAEQRDTGKGVFYFAVMEKPGGQTIDALPAIIDAAIRELPWPKSMRWGDAQFRWVRPLHAITALFDGQVIPGALTLGTSEPAPEASDGTVCLAGEVTATVLRYGNITYGHRFLAPDAITVTGFAQYAEALRKACVILDREERKRLILDGARKAAEAEGYVLKDDPGLLEEVAGLVEWPVVLTGAIDQQFMDVPAEVLTTSMRTHQRYFALETADGKLAPRFVVVANRPTADGGKAVVAGNERVLRARLSDAKFFWDQDLATPLETRREALAQITFHEKLGTMLERVERIEKLAVEIAGALNYDAEMTDQVRTAARLCKADLVTGVVGEFPEVQGILGGYVARAQGQPAAVATAIADHYKPLGPSDRVPTDKVAVAVALADKIDTLVAFFGIDEKPTGSRDPFALRRAALGVIRLVVENGLRINLSTPLTKAYGPVIASVSRTGLLFNYDHKSNEDFFFQTYEGWLSQNHRLGLLRQKPKSMKDLQIDMDNGDWQAVLPAAELANDLLTFFADRLKVTLKDKGVRHDLIDAVFALGGQDDLVLLLKRVDALAGFVTSEDGANLLTAYKRAANILRIEEKKDGTTFSGKVDVTKLALAEEMALFGALEDTGATVGPLLEAEDFTGAMKALSALRAPVDAFFDKVTVNAPEPELRANRLRLLSQIRDTLNRVADFSRIEG